MKSGSGLRSCRNRTAAPHQRLENISSFTSVSRTELSKWWRICSARMNRTRNGPVRAFKLRMNTIMRAPEEIVERAAALAKSDRNMDMMDCVTVLRGYLSLRTLDPENGMYRGKVEDA